MAIIGTWLTRIYGEENPMIEACLVGCIEAIEDRIPTDEDIGIFLRAHRKPPFVSYTWKGREIVRVEVDQFSARPGQIFSLVNPFANIPE